MFPLSSKTKDQKAVTVRTQELCLTMSYLISERKLYQTVLLYLYQDPQKCKKVICTEMTITYLDESGFTVYILA